MKDSSKNRAASQSDSEPADSNNNVDKSENLDQGGLKRSLTLVPVIALGVGSTVGAGIFSTMSQVAMQAQSSLFLVIAFLIGSLMQIPSALCYGELSSAYPYDGCQYIYFREAGSRPLAFLSGWISIIATDPPSVAIMTLSLVNYMSIVLPFSNITLRIIAMIIVVAFAILHIISVKGGGIFQTFITVVKIIPFVLIVCVGVFFINPDLFMSVDQIDYNIVIEQQGSSLLAAGGIIALLGAVSTSSFSFDGLYSACYLSGEIKNPKKTLPIGLILTAIIVMVLYVTLSMVTTGFLTIDEIATSSAPIASVAAHFPVIGAYAEKAVAIMAIIVILGTISSCIMYQPRIEYAMAQDGLFFKCFGKVSKKYNTPYVAIILHTIIILTLTFVGDLSDILSYFTIVVLLKNLGSYATMFVLRKKSDYNPGFRCPWGMTMPIVCVVFTLLLIVATILSTSFIGVLVAVVMMAAGLPIYYLWDRKNIRSRKNK